MTNDLSLPLADLDADSILGDWLWLLKEPHALLMVTAMGDAFVATPRGEVHFLDTLEGALKFVAASREEFFSLMSSGDYDRAWFLPDMVAVQRARGAHLEPGQCYGYKVPPVLGGSLDSGNVAPTDALVHFSLAGQLHRQLFDLPAGARISGFVFAEPSTTPGNTSPSSSASAGTTKPPTLARRLARWFGEEERGE